MKGGLSIWQPSNQLRRRLGWRTSGFCSIENGKPKAIKPCSASVEERKTPRFLFKNSHFEHFFDEFHAFFRRFCTFSTCFCANLRTIASEIENFSPIWSSLCHHRKAARPRGSRVTINAGRRS